MTETEFLEAFKARAGEFKVTKYSSRIRSKDDSYWCPIQVIGDSHSLRGAIDKLGLDGNLSTAIIFAADFPVKECQPEHQRVIRTAMVEAIKASEEKSNG